MIKRTVFTFILFLSPLFAHATNFKPWLGEVYELNLKTSIWYQEFQKAASYHNFPYNSNNIFVNLGAEFAYSEQIGLEFELLGAHTRRQAADLDCIRFSGSYVFSDDIAGDPMTITGQITLSQVFRSALEDIGSFHCGRFEAEARISIGKELPFETTWQSRTWSVLGIGMGSHGSPWIRANIDIETKPCCTYAVGVFVHTLWGLGKHELRRHNFQGYGSTQHQSVDVGARYLYEFEFIGTLALEYAYRVYARNFPMNANTVKLSFDFPKGF